MFLGILKANTRLNSPSTSYTAATKSAVSFCTPRGCRTTSRMHFHAAPQIAVLNTASGSASQARPSGPGWHSAFASVSFMAIRCDLQLQGDAIKSARARLRPTGAGGAVKLPVVKLT